MRRGALCHLACQARWRAHWLIRMGKPEFVAPSGSEGEGWRDWPGRAGGNASALGGGLGWTPFKVYSGLEKNCVSVLLNSQENNWPTGEEARDHLDGCWVWREDCDCVGRVGGEVLVSKSGT